MRQTFPLIILFLLGSCNLTEQDQITSDLNGKVKQIVETTDHAILDNGNYRPLAVDGIPNMKKIKSYNKKGGLEEMRLLFDDQLISKVEIRYNSKGQMSKQQHFDPSGQLTKTVERTSDSTTVTNDTRGFGTVETSEKYLSPQIQREVSLNSDQGLTTIATFTRDNKKWITQVHQITVHKGDTTANGTEYYKYTETDLNDNWIKCLISASSQFDTVQVKTREIDYYKE